VMILSSGPLQTILRKCGCSNEESGDEKEGTQSIPRLMQFAIGVKVVVVIASKKI
jgi:hypothetical protein